MVKATYKSDLPCSAMLNLKRNVARMSLKSFLNVGAWSFQPKSFLSFLHLIQHLLMAKHYNDLINSG